MKFNECFQKNIAVIKSMLDYDRNRDQEINNIPLAHQNLVMESFENTRDNPNRLLDWDETKELLKTQ